jgi:DNA polymerase-3 subunit gamma/tau
VAGQEVIVTTLKNALRSGRLGQAYLFSGSRGTGKTTLARLFAKALNCHRLTEDFEPCNQCSSCVEISTGRSLDVLEIDGASNRGIDDVRKITETVGYAPASGKYKIYIIDEVHMLTKEAFNALLKTLEEPPAQTKFFFATTEPHKVPLTIASRCQRFSLARISDQACVQKLAAIAKELKIEIQEAALYLIAHLSEGSLRDAESLLDQLSCSVDGPVTEEAVIFHLGIVPRSLFFTVDEAILKGDNSFAFKVVEQLYNAGKDLDCFLEDLTHHFRLLLLIKLKQPLPSMDEKMKKNCLAAAEKYTQEHLFYILDFLMQEWPNFSKTQLKRTTLEMLLLHLIRSKARVPIEDVVRRLIELEQGAPEMTAAPIAPAPVVVEEPKVVELPPLVELAALSEIVEEKITPLKKVEEPVVIKEEEKIAPKEFVVKREAKYETLLRFAAVELEGNLERRTNG